MTREKTGIIMEKNEGEEGQSSVSAALKESWDG